jgi:lipopolysaccharide transport system permease protein
MEEFDLIIRPKRNAFDINFKEFWHYRDLLRMFVKRDIVTVYKQTILGPIWFLIQPIFTTIIFMFVFGRIANISTDGTPQLLFYMAGITIWNYFAESFNSTANTFADNAHLFGKVYFPRLIIPVAKVISALIKFIIQFSLFLTIYFYYIVTGNSGVNPNWTIVLVPLYILLMALFGLGIGIIFTSLTTKYRDLVFLLSFFVQLLMYASPVIYPVSSIPDGTLKQIVLLNPFTSILEGFKYAFLGAGHFSIMSIGYSVGVAILLMLAGILIFHKTESNFIDTV